MALVSPPPSCQGQGQPEPEVSYPLPAYTLLTGDGKAFVFVITVTRLIGKSINITVMPGWAYWIRVGPPPPPPPPMRTPNTTMVLGVCVCSEIAGLSLQMSPIISG